MDRLAIAFVVLAGVGAAQTVVIPIGTALSEGDSSNAFPWGRGGEGLHTQHVYDSSNFRSQGIFTPIVITRLRWRLETGVATLASSYPVGATVQLSTCPVDQSLVTPVFVANQGADLTTVFSGPVAWPAAGPVVGPCPFLIDIPLSTPFFYDPNAGDLNIEIELPIQPFTGSTGGTGLQLDMQSAGSLSSRVYMVYGYPTGMIGTDPDLGMVVELTYGPPGAYASHSAYGDGCYSKFTSFYEHFPDPATFDLGGTALSMLPSGGGYTVIPGFTSYVAPSAAAMPLPLMDDSVANVLLGSPFPHSTGATTSLWVCSNGFVSVASGNGTMWTPEVGKFLHAPRTGWWNWHDYNPTIPGSGQVKYQEIGSISYITWDGVWDFGGTSAANANTFQFQFDRATGAVHIVWGTTSGLGNGCLVGYSPGGQSRDPGNRDISATLPGAFFADAADVAALAHTASARPVMGTSIQLRTSNVPVGSLIGANVLAFTQVSPGIDLGFLGAGGCTLNAGLDVALTFVPVGGLGAIALTIPGSMAYAGLSVFSQGAALLTGVNPLGLLTSNGVWLVIGTH